MSLLQEGENNQSDVTQNNGLTGSGGNHALVTQTSDDNFSTILQEGTNNLATVSQTVSSGNVSNITQTGSNNTATVTQ